MKNIRRIICAVIAVAMLCVVLCSCGHGAVYAIYKGGKIYQSDIDGWVQYRLTTDQITDQTEINKTVDSIVKTSAIYRLYELELKAAGITVTSADIKEKTDYYKGLFNLEYAESEEKDGYTAWKKEYGVDDAFFKELVRRDIVEDLKNKYIYDNFNVTEQMCLDYYNENRIDFIKLPGYYFTGVLVEVKDRASGSGEWETAKAAARDYIARINGGEDFDTVAAEIKSKYSVANGYSHAEIISGADYVLKASADYIQVSSQEELDAKIAELKASYEEENGPLNPDAAVDTDEFNDYMIYLGKEFKLRLNYALQNEMRLGEVYSEPVKSPVGYWIYRYDALGSGEIPEFESVRASIVNTLNLNAVNDTDYLLEFQNGLVEKYELTIIQYGE